MQKMDRKYYMANPALDQQVADVRRRIRLAMNGVVAEHMTSHGAVYRQNYGVSVLSLREIARRYEKNHDLAQRLWALGIRETMILATLLEPEQTCSLDDARRWVADFHQIELVEQACMNLFSKMPRARELCMALLDADDDWSRVTAFTLSARIYASLTDEEAGLLLRKGMEWSATDNYFLYKAIALSLASISRRGRETADRVVAELQQLKGSSLTGQRYIVHEVEGEVSFLDFL